MKKRLLYLLCALIIPSNNFAQIAFKDPIIKQLQNEYDLARRATRALPKLTDIKALTQQDRQDLLSIGKRVGAMLLLFALIIGGIVGYRKFRKPSDGGTGPQLPPAPSVGQLPPPILEEGQLPPLPPVSQLPPSILPEAQLPAPQLQPGQLPPPLIEELPPFVEAGQPQPLPMGILPQGARPRRAPAMQPQKQPQLRESIGEQALSEQRARLKRVSQEEKKKQEPQVPTSTQQMLGKAQQLEEEMGGPVSTEVTRSWLEGGPMPEPTREEKAREAIQAGEFKARSEAQRLQTQPVIMAPRPMTPQEQAAAEQTAKQLQEALKKRRKTVEESGGLEGSEYD